VGSLSTGLESVNDKVPGETKWSNVSGAITSGPLKLPVLEQRKGQLTNGHIVEYDVVGPLEVRFKNRRCSINAMVLPGDNEPLLGAIPLEDMDVIIHPHRQELIVNPDHPYFAQMKLK
jgi:hypothetical protein